MRDTIIRTYDGRRLASMTVHAVQRGETLLGDARVRVIHAVLKHEPIYGYTPKE